MEDSLPGLAPCEGGTGIGWAGLGYVAVQQEDTEAGGKFALRWGDCQDVMTVNGKLQLHHRGRATALFLHGAGQSSLSWTTTVQALKRMGVAVNLVAIDLRDHGLTTANRGSDGKLMSKDTLVQDVLQVLHQLVQQEQHLHEQLECEDSPVELFLIGHSMGGAIASWLAESLTHAPTRYKLKGLFVMDVVEETALNGLEYTRKLLQGRPAGFDSLQKAIEWAMGSGLLHHRESASYSLRGQLKVNTERENGHGPQLVWRTDVVSYFDAWKTWFQGLSHAFLSVSVTNKSILLAGIDSLDKTMIVGQMQGKFKLLVFPEVKVGHFVHEDAPERTAGALKMFFNRTDTLPPHLLRANQALSKSSS